MLSNGLILSAGVRTVPEVLRDHGFATAAVVASYPVASRFGFAQGFDAFFEDFTQSPVANRRWEGHQVPEDRFFSFADTVTDRALERLDEMDREAERSQFLWVHYFDPHDPYGDTGAGPRLSPRRAQALIERGKDVSRLLTRFRAAYDRDVAFLDRHLDRLLARLDTDGRRFATHVVIASDHGESFGEGGALVHGMGLTDEQLRVPLVILSPRVAPGVRREVAGSIDVARTLLSLAGVPASEDPWSRARDLSRPGADATGSTPASRFAALGMRRTFANRKMTELRADGSRHPLDELQFYAVDRQGGFYRGNRSALDERPAAADAATERRVAGLFRTFEEQVGAATAPATDAEGKAALRALGYVE